MTIKIDTNNGLINIILVLVVMKIALLTVIALFNRTFNYKKIFNNTFKSYYSQLKSEMFMLDKQGPLNPMIKVDLLGADKKIGFLPDNASFLCPHGLELYKLNQNRIYGYFGLRVFKKDDKILGLILQKEQYYQELLAIKKNIKVKDLQMIDSNNNNQIDQIFAIDESNRLWLYNVELDQMFLLHSKYRSDEHVDYIVINEIFNLHNKPPELDYKPGLIMFLCSKNSFKDYIDIFYVNLEKFSKRQLTKLFFNNHIGKFVIYRDYMVVIYKDLNLLPTAYKIFTNSKRSIEMQKVNIQFNLQRQQLVNCTKESQESINSPQFVFSWDPRLCLHQAIIVNTNCLALKYHFNLPTDQGIVSFRTIDY